MDHEQPNVSPSLWAAYVLELRGGSTQFIEYPWGFTCYSFPDFAPECIYMEEVYVAPEVRMQGKAATLAGEIMRIGRKSGKTHILGIVRVSSKTAHYTLKGYLDWGFRAMSAVNDGESGAIWLKKPIPPEGA